MPESLSERRYFYCNSLPLEPGSIVRPGNWGRILKLYTPQTHQSPWLLVRELIYEQVRREVFLEKPSRFESNYLCTRKEDLVEFRNSTNRWLDLAYEVELTDVNALSHLGDLSLANMQPLDNYNIFESRARLYWQGQSIVKCELL